MSFPWGGPRWAQTRLGRLLGHHYAFVVTRWGFGKSMATILARAGSQKLALGAVATGATGLTIHHNTKERHFGSDVLSSEQEVEWLNAAIKPIWDHLDAGVRKIIEDEIRPALQQRLGKRLGSYLQFTQLTLGSASPRFGPVRVSRSDHGLEINAGFSFEGNGMLEFSAGVASVQVCNITVQGSLRLGLQPLLESLNPVGGVSVTCLERPMIDLTIKTGTELIPNLYNFVRDTVDDVIADLIVVPNMVAVPIDDSVDGCSLQHPLPLGFLRLSLEGITAAGPRGGRARRSMLAEWLGHSLQLLATGGMAGGQREGAGGIFARSAAAFPRLFPRLHGPRHRPLAAEQRSGLRARSDARACGGTNDRCSRSRRGIRAC